MISITPDVARRFLVNHLGLNQPHVGDVTSLLNRLRCIQLDPLDPMGTNADLVAMARLDGIGRGDVYNVMPGGAFEHFAKERCLLPAGAFPYYRDQAHETPWWRLGERERRLPPGVLDAVLSEVEARGPLTTAELSDHGAVKAMDYSGWKGTGRAATLAIQVLWTRCQVVVCGRRGAHKLYEIPGRALPEVANSPAGDFAPWAVTERVEAAGLLARAGGPQWSMLRDVRTSELPDQMLADGRLVEVSVTGSRRPYLAPADFRERAQTDPDGRLRILGPLDPVLWDRKLVHHVFGFEYIWEVYKPEAKRRWGWYVCPLLFDGLLVGRIDARIQDSTLVVSRLWRERPFSEAALTQALERHAAACGANGVAIVRT